jgi:hypothetical protein
MEGPYTGCIYSVVGGHCFDANADPDLNFLFDVNTDLDPYHTTSFTHIGKSEIFNFLFDFSLPVFLVSVIIFITLDSILQFFL